MRFLELSLLPVLCSALCFSCNDGKANAADSKVAIQPANSWLALTPGTSWHLQLQGTLQEKSNSKVYDIDVWDTPESAIRRLTASGHYVVCYFSAGTSESWRSDFKMLPAAALGIPLPEWDGESWLDVRHEAVRNLAKSRMDLAVQKGCNGVDPDNVDGYSNDPGFPLTEQDQINFNSFLADEAHKRGLGIGLKNAGDLVSVLQPKFDWALVEQCAEFSECDSYKPFTANGKAVFQVEYKKAKAATCKAAQALKFDVKFYTKALSGGGTVCP